MKKRYESPLAQMLALESADVITSSGGGVHSSLLPADEDITWDKF